MLRKREEKDTKIQPISTTLKVWGETKKEEWTVRVKNNFKVFNVDWILTSINKFRESKKKENDKEKWWQDVGKFNNQAWIEWWM